MAGLASLAVAATSVLTFTGTAVADPASAPAGAAADSGRGKGTVASVDALRTAARSEDFEAFALEGLTFNADLRLEVERIESQNVLGKITGTERPDETIMLSGHWDAYGKGIAARGEVDLQQIVDVCPTLLHSMGLSVPSDLEGQVALNFFDEGWLNEHPVKQGAKTRAVASRAPSEEMDAQERQQMIEQLQMLGYME